MADKVIPQVADTSIAQQADTSNTQVVDTSIAELESLSPEERARIDALGQRVDQLLSTDSSQSVGGQSLGAETAAVTPSNPTSSDDVILGTQGDDEISALGGNDTVVSLAGNDRVFGGPGNDDIIAGGGNDFVDGGTGNDLIFGDSDLNRPPDFGASGDDTLDGGAGTDTVFGGAGNDALSGGAGDDNLFGQDGNDSLNGNNGPDNLNGGAGDDIITGGSGNDRFFAGDGNDQLFGEDGNDQLNADAGDDIVSGGGGNDVVFGGQGNDSLTGEAGTDEVVGGAGNDSLSGGNGNDRLIGVDPFVPQLGFGRGERDNLTGGGGSDTFVLGTSTEVFYDDLGNSDFALINDFNLSQDFIELPANPQTFKVIEIADAGQLLPDAQVIPSGSATLNSINGTISSNNDVDLFQINLTGGGTFSATTFGTDTTVPDPQLFLFDANGVLIDQNDDSNGTLQSTLPASPLTSLDAGTYFLGISSFNNDPVGSPLSGFTDTGFSSGDYTIALTGVQGAAPTFSLGASPDGLPQGTGISFGEDLIGVVAGIAPSQLSLGGGNFVFV